MFDRALWGMPRGWAEPWPTMARICCASLVILGSSVTQAPAHGTAPGETGAKTATKTAAPPDAAQALLFEKLQAARSLPAHRRAAARREIARLMLGLPVASATTASARALPDPDPAPVLVMRPAIDDLLDLIAEAEAGPKGYDAVQVRAVIAPPKPPTQMTLAEIQDWIAATPGQQHAIGRYQIIPDTLAYLMVVMGVEPDAVFDPVLQDRMAVRLLDDAGLDAFLRQEMDHDSFMDAVAWIWAGLPLRSGLSAYHNYNGNRATISRDTYETRFARIFP